MKVFLFSLLMGFSGMASAVSGPELYQSFSRTLLKRYVNPGQRDLAGLIELHRAEMQQACDTTPGCPAASAYPAITGVMNEIKDGHANFLTPEQAALFRSRSAGTSTGFFGLQSSKLQNGKTLVLDVVKGGPADLAGLGRFDVLENLDTSLTTAPQTVKVLRRGTFPLQVTVNPQSTPLVFLPGLVRYGNIGVLRIPTFSGSNSIAEVVHQLVARASTEQMTGLVVDLRSNGGGHSEQCLLAALAFNPHFTEEWIQVGWQNSLIAEGGQLKFKLPGFMPIPYASVQTLALWSHPAVFLVNERSASCAEFMAYEAGKSSLVTVMGETTYGVANTSTLLYGLPDGSALQLSILYVLEEDQTPYPGKITPDVLVDDDPEQIAVGQDHLLQEAFRLLEQQGIR